jgi:ABC-type sulfate transport system substrate-binding protein
VRNFSNKQSKCIAKKKLKTKERVLGHIRRKILENVVLYDTKLKTLFKFYVDNKKAQVLIDIEPRNNDTRNAYFDKLEALKIF